MALKTGLVHLSKTQQPLWGTLLSCEVLTFPPNASVLQVRGAKQKFGGITRDPYRTLKKKLVLQKAQKVSKVPLMSSERRDKTVEFPINRTSSGENTGELKIAINQHSVQLVVLSYS